MSMFSGKRSDSMQAFSCWPGSFIVSPNDWLTRKMHDAPMGPLGRPQAFGLPDSIDMWGLIRVTAVHISIASIRNHSQRGEAICRSCGEWQRGQWGRGLPPSSPSPPRTASFYPHPGFHTQELSNRSENVCRIRRHNSDNMKNYFSFELFSKQTKSTRI